MASNIAYWVIIARDAITGIAAVVVAAVAGMGLRTWKRQLFGNANYELARRFLRSTYKLREAIAYLRDPFMSAGEMAAGEKPAGLSDAPTHGFNDEQEALAYQTRWQKVADARVDFDAELLEAEVLWGSEMRQRAQVLLTCTNELYGSLGRWLARRRRPLEAGREERIAAIIWDSGDSSEFSNRLKAAFESIEEGIRPHLKL